MPSFQPTTLTWTLAPGTFDTVRQVLQQMAQGLGASLLTEDLFVPSNILSSQDHFIAVLSKQFNALLWTDNKEGNIEAEMPETLVEPKQAAPQLPPDVSGQVKLTFDVKEIANFLHQHRHRFTESRVTEFDFLNLAKLHHKANDATLQSEFSLRLLDALAENSFQPEIAPCPSVCKPVEDALQQQIAQERLLNQVTSHIRQSLELPVILSTAVQQVQQFLQVDRLVIYQFRFRSNPGVNEGPEALKKHRFNTGRVTYEALAHNQITSVLNTIEANTCFVDVPNYREKYRKGFIQAVNDVELVYKTQPCFLEFLRHYQIRAKLVAPIVMQQELWGLLIANQCSLREWEESEKRFLGQIAEHLAIAIYQAELYAQVQQQKQTLEQRVFERTQELCDALASAQSANRTKSEFLATMSHELRTPLTCVIGISSTLLRWSYGQTGQKEVPLKKQREYLQIIRDSGEHLLEMIDDILDFSKVEAGKSVLKVSKFSLSKLALQSLHAFKDKAAFKEIALSLEQEIGPGRDFFIADPRRVKQILFNLLGNAIKFTPEKGRVTLRVWVEDNRAFFQVEDTGIGIPENQHPLLFEKFQQLDSPYRRQYGGAGLGLALAKQLVELHGGLIEVESTVDVGSIFTVQIPAQVISQPSKNKLAADNLLETSLGNEVKKGRLGVIEEDEETATLICDILTAAGYQVVWIIEGSTAVDQIELLQPVGVIVDRRLPGRNGDEIIYSLRNKSVTQHLKILALTASTISLEGKDLLEVGADDYLLKPVVPEELVHKITTLMAEDRYDVS